MLRSKVVRPEYFFHSEFIFGVCDQIMIAYIYFIHWNPKLKPLYIAYIFSWRRLCFGLQFLSFGWYQSDRCRPGMSIYLLGKRMQTCCTLNRAATTVGSRRHCAVVSVVHACLAPDSAASVWLWTNVVTWTRQLAWPRNEWPFLSACWPAAYIPQFYNFGVSNRPIIQYFNF